MNFRTILAFQFGNRDAIGKAAKSSSTLWTGLILTLTVSIARNYDQSWILDSPLWLFGNVLFSLVSSSLIFVLVYGFFLKKQFSQNDVRPSFAQQYRSFLGLFWMTAPIAWLYAIPVERWFDSYLAAQCNLALLGIVSLWRVLLLARVISVVTQTQYVRTLFWTLFVASTEVVIVMVIGAFSNFDSRVLSGMSGMRNSPEEDMMMNALGYVFIVSLFVWLLSLIVTAVWQYSSGKPQPFPKINCYRVQWTPLLIATTCWLVIATGPQIRLKNNSNYDHLVRAGEYDEAMAYLQSREQSDFSHYKHLAPEPYEWEVWEHLGPLLNQIAADEPSWVTEHYRYHMSAVFTQEIDSVFYRFHDQESVYLPIVKAASRLDKDDTFTKEHHEQLIELREIAIDYGDSVPLAKEMAELQTLLNDLLGPLPKEN